MKRWLLYASLIFSVTMMLAARPASLQHPPLPQKDEDGPAVAIVMTEGKMAKHEIERMIASKPRMKIRYIFRHAVDGFSVEGPLREIEELKETHGIQLVSAVKQYRADSAGNMEIIGGEEVRGIFDDKGQRLTGRGVTVGVIDTGIDYRHPDLRRNYGGGRDLVDGDSDPMETRGIGPGNTFHGTHVAGIIAANGKISGIAPEATIKAYRALGPGGSGTTEQVLAAIDKAIEDKVDILNLSLGNEVNGPDLPISLALNKATEHGVTAVTSSGNSGPNKWTVGSPGTAAKAISVGASTPPLKVPYLTLAGELDKIRLEPMQGSAQWGFDRSVEMVNGGIGRKQDMKNVAGKIVLIERGKLSFTEKAKNAQKAKAAGIVIYNNTKGSFFGNLEEPISIPAAAVSKEQGHKLMRLADNRSLFARMLLIEEKDLLADFSSRGPVTVTWDIKPDVVAPGVAIESTIPGGYLSLQGTSMAAPHVAGTCALIKQAHPDWSPEQIKSALMNTALPIHDLGGSSYKAYEQGAGRIQAKEAVNAGTLVLPGSLRFGKFQLADNRNSHTAAVEIENHSGQKQRYSFDMPYKEPGLQWQLPMAFELEPGSKKRVEIRMNVEPAEFKGKIHDGAIFLNSASGKVRIPYLYVLEEPDYPRVMGFDFAPADKSGSYRYEVYLPGGAEEFGIALFDPDNFQFRGFLDWDRNVAKGLLQRELPQEKLPVSGTYLVKVFAKKAGREDVYETTVYIGQEEGQTYP
ncbi:peptidase S8 [Mesobacillus zeae]|uniref:Peptidase S8 n=1 Tax=Mesobacillus zeae TaxID=1917180 RepID=A0A398AXT5_9BACI|nr:peptidase S8 [Mesobacillus zeae]